MPCKGLLEGVPTAYRGLMTSPRILPMALIAVMLTFAVGMGHQTAAAAVDVSGDDANDQFVGSGQSAGHSPGSAATEGGHRSCAGCSWMATDPCPAGSSSINCGVVSAGCPSGQVQRLMWFSDDAGATWDNRGLRCLSAVGHVATGPATLPVRESFARAVPPAQITWQPEHGLLAQVPTLFSSGQPARPTPSIHEIGGMQIRLAPVAHWHWDFGDGAVLDTQVAGSRFPDREVSHVYRKAGVYEVRLHTTWTATYTVDDRGPYPVAGTVTQLAAAQIRVGQGRAVLS